VWRPAARARPSPSLLPSLPRLPRPAAQAWNIYTAPGALAALWVMERSGLRTCLLWGYGSQLACALLAYAAVAMPAPPRVAFGVLYLSQARTHAHSVRPSFRAQSHSHPPPPLNRCLGRWASR
jgi:hypothetical protein